MTNLLTVLPDFDTQPYSHILPSLEKASISTADLLTLDAFDIAKRAQVPPHGVKKLCTALLEGLQASLTLHMTQADDKNNDAAANNVANTSHAISTLDDELNAKLGGGIAAGELTELVGESAAGKTQFLLSLLLAVQLHPPHGPGKSALYISTEAPLQTPRLSQILQTNSKIQDLSPDQRPSLNRVQSTHIHDLEAQDHILRYQVPVAIKRHDVGLLIIDSIAANYRPEFDKGNVRKTAAESFIKRSNQVTQLGKLLRDLARIHGIAVVVANQVSDRFAFEPPGQVPISQQTQRSRPASPPQAVPMTGTMSQHVTSQTPTAPQSLLTTDDPLALDHQQRFFTGWGDDANVSNPKTPSLGLAWTNQLATRIALLKEPQYEMKAYKPGEESNVSGWKRTLKIVFSSQSAASSTEFEIVQGGVKAVRKKEDDS
ncbi:DNA repair protein rhp57 [Recurvomyces mirabilis]|uniref:DNA repair protein rhp57 n=1 Tax=Recurvomyces mirabilis TaxID=574656 RepID=A0AAE0TLM6_9PEZI|nr:DNA repair protein rhp57 [Recurvomyces mirabilis]KAK5155595.1 DNA repair protein rhp57 [Recurvomyces mirabilis]